VSDFQDVICPSCREAHLVDLDELPVEGGFRACPHCGTSIKVTRDPAQGIAMVSAIPVRQDTEASEEAFTVLLRMPSGNIERMSFQAIEQGIQMKRVLPWDLISEDEREFIQVSVRPELRRLFASGDFIAKPQTRCANHADLMPAATCRRCGRSYCSQCADGLLRIQPRLCPACNGPCGEPDPRLREEPPWRRPTEILRFPIDQNSWIVTLLLGALLWIASSSLLLLPLQLLALPVLVDAVIRSSRGGRTWAILSRLSDIDGGSLLRTTIPIAILSIVLALPLLVIPFVVGTWIGVLLQFPIVLFIFFYYPMSVALLLVSDVGERAIRPRTVLRVIWALRDEYFLYLALFIAVAVGIVGVVLVLSFIPFVYGVLHSIAVAYGWVLQAHILGFFIYMNRERLRAAV
jgi:hypothetical protein